MMNIFTAADILLPHTSYPLEKWAVVACDQFTSEPEYWQQVRTIADGFYSAVNLVLPEAELGMRGSSDIEKIHNTMLQYMQDGVYEEIPGAFVYVERRQADGSLRKGIVGCLDLEAYDFHPDSGAPVRASEQTVTERIPARVAVREDAQTETSHVILYADDEKDSLIGTAGQAKEKGRLLYDFDLMMEGGRIAGWLLDAQTASELAFALQVYYAQQEEKAAQLGKAPLYFAVGDGNHSLAAAKACYEKAKTADPSAASSPLRYALVELENVHDTAQVFHPIHRILRGIDPGAFLKELRAVSEQSSGQAIEVPVLTADGEEILVFHAEDPAGLIIELQHFMDVFVRENGGEIDYIHGSETLRRMIGAGCAGILMPLIGKKDFFRDIMMEGCFARKSFSIGSARDKRYYLEVRSLL